VSGLRAVALSCLKTKAPNNTGSNHLYNTLELLMMISNKICDKNHLLHPVSILFPYINDDARSKPHQIYRFWFSGKWCCVSRLVFALFRRKVLLYLQGLIGIRTSVISSIVSWNICSYYLRMNFLGHSAHISSLLQLLPGERRLF
jgi:hypothetical protein